MVADKKDRCGVGLLSSDASDPFIDACKWHDRAYVDKENKISILSRKQVDEQFLKQMLLIASGRKRLVIKAYAYYYAARLFGGYLWKW